MREKHWTEDQIIAEFYGVGPEDGHLDQCPACRARLDLLVRNQQHRLRKNFPVSPALLAAQRMSVLNRIEHQTRWWSRFHLIPVTAAALMVLAVLLMAPFQWTVKTPDNAKQRATEAQLFEEAFAKAYNMESAVSQPLQALFEVKQ